MSPSSEFNGYSGLSKDCSSSHLAATADGVKDSSVFQIAPGGQPRPVARSASPSVSHHPAKGGVLTLLVKGRIGQDDGKGTHLRSARTAPRTRTRRRAQRCGRLPRGPSHSANLHRHFQIADGVEVGDATHILCRQDADQRRDELGLEALEHVGRHDGLGHGRRCDLWDQLSCVVSAGSCSMGRSLADLGTPLLTETCSPPCGGFARLGRTALHKVPQRDIQGR